jgi:glyoxylase-like metal-dependent hydrolase (beta-lactamase superfamily II)
VQPTNPEQFRQAMAGEIADSDEVRDGIWSIPLEMIHQSKLIYSLCYAFEDAEGGVHLLDTGYDTPRNLARIEAGLASRGHALSDVVGIAATHLHPDHLGLAQRIRSMTGASVSLGRVEQRAVDNLEGGEDIAGAAVVWGVPAERMSEVESVLVAREKAPGFVADLLLDDGDELPIPGRSIRALSTPGHTDGHLSYVDEQSGLVFTGDHVLPVIFSGLGLGSRLQTDPIGDFFASLERVAAYDDYEVAPGHWYRFRGLAERCDEILAHHLKRSSQVAAALENTPDGSTWQIASQLGWTAGWDNLSGFMVFSALLQTDMHIAYLRNRATS